MKISSLPCCVSSSSTTPLLPPLLSALPSLTVSVSDPVAIEKTLNIFVATSKEVIFYPSTPTQQKTFHRLLNFANVKFTLFLLFAALHDILMTVVAAVELLRLFVCPQHLTLKIFQNRVDNKI